MIKNPTASKRHRFDPWVGKISWRRAWKPTPVFLPGEFCGWRSLVGYSPWGHKESNMTEQLSMQSTHKSGADRVGLSLQGIQEFENSGTSSYLQSHIHLLRRAYLSFVGLPYSSKIMVSYALSSCPFLQR